jgi:hypothetical protein
MNTPIVRYKPIIAVDFDGTITRRSTFPRKPKKEELADNCIEVLQRLHDAGCEIILWTCRAGKELLDAITFCAEVGIPLDYVNTPTKECYEVWGNLYESRKVFANYYIDDFNLGGFPGWLEAERIIMQDKFFLEG